VAQGAVYVQYIWGEAIACGKRRQKGNTWVTEDCVLHCQYVSYIG